VTQNGFLGGVSRFWGELRRRKVVKVALVYLAAAWIIIEVASVVLPELMLPDWSVRLLIVLAAAGFPLAVVLAWVFDITPQGVLRTPPAVAETPEARAPAMRPAPPERSLAVLPFRNIGGERDNEYFVDGLAEDILILLARVDGLRVAARSSSFALRDSDAREIGTRLNVASVLEGSVRKAGNRVRVTAQLIDGATGQHLWAERYDREWTDIFTVQDQLTQQIVSALKVNLTADENHRVRRRGTDSIEAYEVFLRGRELLHLRTREGVALSRPLFEKAIDLAPAFAAAYAGLAFVYALEYVNSWTEAPPHALGTAFRLARQAVALDCAEP
jgi:adenylate cyclase